MPQLVTRKRPLCPLSELVGLWKCTTAGGKTGWDDRELGPQVLLGKQLFWNWAVPTVPSKLLALLWGSPFLL